MADKISKRHRSWVMSRVPSKNTKPERFVRSLLHQLGFRFTVNGPKNRLLPGRPDIVLPKRNTVIFIHGCFWHRHPNCKIATTPKTNTSYWLPKFEKNIERDRNNQIELTELGWHVLIVWECELKNLESLSARLITELPRDSGYILPQDMEDDALVAEEATRYGKQ